MTKKNLMPSIVLAAICIAAALLLSAINLFTAPEIAKRENEKAFEALAEVLPDGANFKQITLDEKYPKNVTEAYSADGGFVFRATGSGGKNGDIVVMVGVSADGKIVGTKVITTAETPGYAEPVYTAAQGTDGKYAGQTLESFEPVIIGGSTMTSKAYANAIEAALKAYVVANGGSVENRTPEEILQDNCNLALGTEGVKFTKWFATVAISGVDAVYESSEGRVYVIGDAFVGVDNNAMITTEDASEENKNAAILANDTIDRATLSEVEKPGGASRTIKKIYKTEGGNYVFEISTTGYEHGHGELVIKVSISADGKIIDCLTVSHGESRGYGDKCATEEYYESWRGTSAGDVVISSSPVTGETTDPGAISGATQTSNGYQKAIKAAFAAFELLTGGNE